MCLGPPLRDPPLRRFWCRSSVVGLLAARRLGLPDDLGYELAAWCEVRWRWDVGAGAASCPQATVDPASGGARVTISDAGVGGLVYAPYGVRLSAVPQRSTQPTTFAVRITRYDRERRASYCRAESLAASLSTGVYKIGADFGGGSLDPCRYPSLDPAGRGAGAVFLTEAGALNARADAVGELPNPAIVVVSVDPGRREIAFSVKPAGAGDDDSAVQHVRSGVDVLLPAAASAAAAAPPLPPLAPPACFVHRRAPPPLRLDAAGTVQAEGADRQQQQQGTPFLAAAEAAAAATAAAAAATAEAAAAPDLSLYTAMVYLNHPGDSVEILSPEDPQVDFHFRRLLSARRSDGDGYGVQAPARMAVGGGGGGGSAVAAATVSHARSPWRVLMPLLAALALCAAC
eukprot:Rhum_TRINITY_DN14676_c12_g2::Rhum_TRINITY_DN14676_c12_g2_i1::g.108622::m.108622